MGNKLSIEIEAGQVKLFVDGEPIGLIFENSVSLIDSIQLSVNDESQAQTEIVFKNFLGGLWEASHEEIIKSMAHAVKSLKGLPVKVSMRFLLGLELTSDEQDWLEKYGKWK